MGTQYIPPSWNEEVTCRELWPFRTGMSLGGSESKALTSPDSSALTCWGPAGTDTKVMPARWMFLASQYLGFLTRTSFSAVV